MTEIRFATPHDVPQILTLIRELAEFEKLLHEVSATEADLQRHLFGERRHAEVLIAEDGPKVLGFALFFHSFSTFLGKPGIYLEDLFVLPSERGHGVGLKLLSRLAALAVERGCGRLEWSVLNWNEGAIRLYLSLGSKPMDEWTMHRMTGEALHALAAKN
jgi:GNAT superfamily N-acetyltransferase